MKTMYEVNWNTACDVFSKCTVTPITVTREGMLPGCTGVTIDAVDVNGRKFVGSPKDYFNTEEEAWESARFDIAQTIDNLEMRLENIKDNLFAYHKFLMEISK